MSDDSRYKAGSTATVAERAAIVAAVEKQSREVELADPDSGLGRVEKSVNRFVEFIGVCTLSLITVLIFVNATLRYGFATSMVWADELVINLIPLMAFCGLILSVRRRKIIRIDTFVEKLPAEKRRYINIFGSLLSAATFGYLCYFALEYLELFGGDKMVYFNLPKGLLQSALAGGAALACLTFLAQAWQHARTR